MNVLLTLQRRSRGWSPPRRDLTRWASAALGRRGHGRELGVCTVGEAESARLNARFRGRDKPTNVLSFPPAPLPRAARAGPPPLGELVICPRVLEAEARDLLSNIEGIEFCYFTEVDVVRHPLVQQIIRAYDKRDAERAKK